MRKKDENNGIKNSGKMMVEILNVPDDIPANPLNKAEGVIVLPSVIQDCAGKAQILKGEFRCYY